MAVSIKDVAKEADVSIATVSRVLNDIDVVNDDTKERVLDAIKRLGYRPNIVARSLKTRKTRTIGIIIPDISNQFYPEIVRGAEDASNIYNYNIILCNTDQDTEKEIEYLMVLKEKMVDGVLYMSSSLEDEVLNTINELKIPIVLIETQDKENLFPSVTIDNEKASYDAVTYLAEKGNKKIAYIGTPEDALNAGAARYRGYKKALSKKKLKFDESIVRFGGLKVKDGYESMNSIISKCSVDAVFCGSDEVAIGVINSLRDNNIKVPDDVDVIGFGNSYYSSIYYPKLTTMGEPTYDMGSVAMRMLIKIINKEPLEQKDYVLMHELIKRDSCKK